VTQRGHRPDDYFGSTGFAVIAEAPAPFGLGRDLHLDQDGVGVG
jgi:hypothetical protein